MKIKTLCLDPGTTKSGMIEFDGETVGKSHAEMPNDLIASKLQYAKYDLLLMEMVASYGMPVGETVFETCVWIGRFGQAFGWSRTRLVYRKDVKMYLCGSMRAKSSNIRQAILDRFPPTGGGKTPQIGTKKKPGPLYGVKSHSFSALALGLTYFKK